MTRRRPQEATEPIDIWLWVEQSTIALQWPARQHHASELKSIISKLTETCPSVWLKDPAACSDRASFNAAPHQGIWLGLMM